MLRSTIRKLFRKRVSEEARLVRNYNSDKDLLTVTTRYSDGSEETKSYFGTGKVWVSMPDKEPCSPELKEWLYDLQLAEKTRQLLARNVQ